MNFIYFIILAVFLASNPAVQAAFSGSEVPSRSTPRSSVPTLNALDSFQKGVESVAGYAALFQRVYPLTGDETETQVDSNPADLLRNFKDALDKGSPGLYGTLPPVFFEKMGQAVAKKWVDEKAFTFDILEIWKALIQSTETEIVRFLITHPIEEGGKVYVYKEPNTDGLRLSNPIKFDKDKVATHFPCNYRLVRVQ